MRQLATRVAGVIALCTLVPATAVAAPFRISADPGTIVLEYGHVQHALAEQDPLPLIRIYGDGLVWVHYPVYTQRAGDYEFRLELKEVRRLIREIRRDGLLEFDRDRTLRQRTAMRGETSSADQLSDAADTVIRIRLERYKGGIDFDKSIVWTGVDTDARAFPDLSPVQSLARLEQKLRAMIDNRPLSAVELPLAQR